MNLHTTAQFHKLCQVFENDFFRPGIFRTMAYLRDNRDRVKVVLYTNNTGSIAWLKMIPRGPPTQMRTSYNKTYEEIKRCAKIPDDAKVIFFDDLEHPGMLDKNVSYIKVKPYVRSLNSSYIIRKLGNNITPKSHQLIHRCITNFQTQRQYKHGTTRIINNDIVQHLLFFLNGKSKKFSTKKRKGYHKKKTRKKNRDKK
jgi:hypothetical protein